jgi:Ca2+-binding RTX toxin-like protein
MSGSDEIQEEGGNDMLNGTDGNDYLSGGDGSESLDGDQVIMNSRAMRGRRVNRRN